MKNIAIIGAGIAGLTAAKHLREAGHQVQVFEKARGRGGRTTTKRLDFGALDIGAQYFTAKSPVFKDAVAAWRKAGLVDIWSFTPFKSDKGSLYPSADETLRFVGKPAMNAICHGLSENIQIHYSTRVSALTRENSAWHISTDTQGVVSGFDKLIIAIPAEQARDLLLPDDILAEKIPPQVHLPCWALGLATSGSAQPDIEGIFGDDVISWVSRLNKKPARSFGADVDDVWMLHFSPQWTQTQGKDTALDLVAVGKAWLEKYLATSLTVVHSYSHFWRYANIMPEYKKPIFREGFLIDPESGMMIIGDWCAGGRIEGAYMSGYRAAKASA